MNLVKVLVSVLDFITNYGGSIKSMNVRYIITVVLVFNVDRTIAKVCIW
jgi:hypothetical protein